MARHLCYLALFPFWCLDDKGGEDSYLSLYRFYSSVWLCGMCDGCIMDKKAFYVWLVKL
jgi:hypothetical protein